MSTYVIIGLGAKDKLIVEDSDKPLYKNIYVLTNPESNTGSSIYYDVVDDTNAIEFYKSKGLENLDETVVFIDCRADVNTYLDVMYKIGASRFDKRTYYVHRGKTLRISDYPPREQFIPWEGNSLPASLTKAERKHIQDIYKNLAEIARSYLKCGFHNKQIIGVPDGWMMNVDNQELDSVILYYGLHPNTADVHRIIEFNHNSQYRAILTKTLVHIVANYLVRNGVVNQSDVPDWFDYKNWELGKLNFYF